MVGSRSIWGVSLVALAVITILVAIPAALGICPSLLLVITLVGGVIAAVNRSSGLWWVIVSFGVVLASLGMTIMIAVVSIVRMHTQ
jgi:hypothetical protein